MALYLFEHAHLSDQFVGVLSGWNVRLFLKLFVYYCFILSVWFLQLFLLPLMNDHSKFILPENKNHVEVTAQSYSISHPANIFGSNLTPLRIFIPFPSSHETSTACSFLSLVPYPATNFKSIPHLACQKLLVNCTPVFFLPHILPLKFLAFSSSIFHSHPTSHQINVGASLLLISFKFKWISSEYILFLPGLVKYNFPSTTCIAVTRRANCVVP